MKGIFLVEKVGDPDLDYETYLIKGTLQEGALKYTHYSVTQPFDLNVLVTQKNDWDYVGSGYAIIGTIPEEML